MQHQFHIFVSGIPFYIINQITQIRLVCIILSGFATHLLKTDIIPFIIFQSCFQCSIRLSSLAPVLNFAITIFCLITISIGPMSFQRTSSDIHITDNSFNAFRFQQFIQILLDCILRKTVANCQNTKRRLFDRYRYYFRKPFSLSWRFHFDESLSCFHTFNLYIGTIVLYDFQYFRIGRCPYIFQVFSFRTAKNWINSHFITSLQANNIFHNHPMITLDRIVHVIVRTRYKRIIYKQKYQEHARFPCYVTF